MGLLVGLMLGIGLFLCLLSGRPPSARRAGTAVRVAALLDEAGVKGFESGTWNAVAAPPKTPAAIVDKLNQAMLETMKTQSVRDKLDAVGLNGLAGRFREFGAVQAVERLNLDGLLALWHPPSSN